MFTCSFKVLTASSNILRKWWIGVSSVISDIADWCKKKSPVFLARLFQQSLCLLVEQWTWPGNAWETNVILRKGVIFTEMLKKEKWFWRKIFTSGPEEERVRVHDGPEPKESVAASEKVFFLKSICSMLFSAWPCLSTTTFKPQLITFSIYMLHVQEDETLVS